MNITNLWQAHLFEVEMRTGLSDFLIALQNIRLQLLIRSALTIQQHMNLKKSLKSAKIVKN